MDSRTLFMGTLFSVAAGCADHAPPPLRFTGTMHVTEAIEATMGITSAAVFGVIVSPGEIVPTASTHGCDYYAMLEGGVSMGDLTITGLAHTVMVSPDGYINGEFYDQYIDAEALAEGSKITATLPDAGDEEPVAVSVDSLAPRPLTSVSLPATVSLTAPTIITWESANADEVSIGLRGSGTGESLDCATSDTGSFTLPPDAVALMQSEELAVTLTRRSVGKASSRPADLELDLAVESQVFRAVSRTP